MYLTKQFLQLRNVLLSSSSPRAKAVFRHRVAVRFMSQTEVCSRVDRWAIHEASERLALEQTSMSERGATAPGGCQTLESRQRSPFEQDRWVSFTPFGLGFGWSGLSLVMLWLMLVRTCGLCIDFTDRWSWATEFAAIHGASGLGGCDMGACRRGYGRWDFYANPSRLNSHGVGAASLLLFCSPAAVFW